MPAFRSSRTVRLSPAFDDRDALWHVVVQGAPYQLMSSLAGYNTEGNEGPVMPWFRRHWAQDGVVVVPASAPFFESPRFLDAAREVAGSDRVRPHRMMLNLMGPMGPGVPHLDTQTFRTAVALPVWLKRVMGASDLFERWWVPVCGSVSWFYEGVGGEYEYWPDGPQAPSRNECAPFGNVAVFADNDRMFHRVGEIAPDAPPVPPGSLSPHSELRPHGEGWRIVDGDTVVAELDARSMRVSMLWAALCFPDADGEARYDDHSDDLTVERITAVFVDDLARRGIACEPDDPLNNSRWEALLEREYPERTHDGAPGRGSTG